MQCVIIEISHPSQHTPTLLFEASQNSYSIPFCDIGTWFFLNIFFISEWSSPFFVYFQIEAIPSTFRLVRKFTWKQLQFTYAKKNRLSAKWGPSVTCSNEHLNFWKKCPSWTFLEKNRRQKRDLCIYGTFAVCLQYPLAVSSHAKTYVKLKSIHCAYCMIK